MTSCVEIEIKDGFDFDIKEVTDAVMEQILETEHCPYEAQVSLLVTDNEGIRQFNRDFREIDRETDVLSFPNLNYESPADFSHVEEETFGCFEPDTGELLLGDIIISADRVREQAESYGHSRKREFAFLVAHSMLHLLGYDHMTDEEAEVMEKKQEEALSALGITRE